MKIIHNNLITSIKEIVLNKAKFQKVLLIHDTSTEAETISELYLQIKDMCIFNKMSIFNLNEKEIFNGYKLIIYLCSGNSFLSIKFNRDEFINIYCPTNSELLPFFLHKGVKRNLNDYLILEKSQIDINAVSSVAFCKFSNIFLSLCNFQTAESSLNFFSNLITEETVFNEIINTPENSFFKDIDLIAKQNILYSDLAIVDLLLIDAYIVFILACKNNNLDLVDFYKSSKNSPKLINKLYSLICNSGIVDIIKINFNCIYDIAIKTKEIILNTLSVTSAKPLNKVDNLINEIKQYAKSNNSDLCYLYLYNVFGC